MSGFLVSPGVYPSECSARPLARSRGGRIMTDRPVVYDPIFVQWLPQAARVLPRPGRVPNRALFSLRPFPQSEDTDSLSGFGLGTATPSGLLVRPRRLRTFGSAGAGSVAHMPPTPAPVVPLPDALVSGRPHHRPAAGRGHDGVSGVFVYDAAWLGSSPLAWSDNGAVLPPRRPRRGCAVFTADPRWPIGEDVFKESAWQGQSVRLVGEEARAGRGGAVQPVRSWEGETLDWTSSLSACARGVRPARRSAGDVTFVSMTTTELPWYDSAFTGQAVRLIPHAREGRAEISVPPLRQPVEQTVIVGAPTALAPRQARPGRTVIDTAAELFASHDDTRVGPTNRGWLFGGVAVAPRIARGGRTSGEWIVSAEHAAPWLVPGQILAAAPRRHARPAPHVEYSAPDWHGVGLIAFAGPGYVVAGSVYFAGAVAGDVVRE